MAGHTRTPPPEGNKIAWGVVEWAHAIGVSRSYVTGLIASKRIVSVKLGYKRLIMTPPAEFLNQLNGNKDEDPASPC